MSNFLDHNSETGSGLRTLLKLIKNRYIKKDEIILVGPKIITTKSRNDAVIIRTGCYNIISNVVRGLYIDMNSSLEALDDRTYIQFKTGEDVSVGINFQVPIFCNDDFILESNKLYVIKLTQDPINNGYLMEWYKE